MPDFSDLLKNSGGDGYAGLSINTYLALVDEILSFPDLPASPANYAESVTIESPDDITFLTGGYFRVFQSQVQKSSLDGSLIGEAGSLAGKNTLNLHHPRISPAVVGWIKEHKNDDFIIVQETANGDFRLLGTPKLPAVIKSGDLPGGIVIEDEKATKLMFEAVGEVGVFYNGLISQTPAA